MYMMIHMIYIYIIIYYQLINLFIYSSYIYLFMYLFIYVFIDLHLCSVYYDPGKYQFCGFVSAPCLTHTHFSWRHPPRHSLFGRESQPDGSLGGQASFRVVLSPLQTAQMGIKVSESKGHEIAVSASTIPVWNTQ